MANSTILIKKVFQSSLSTFFIIDLLSFWNISLLFNFLDVDGQPEFLRKFMETLCMIIYGADGLF